MDIYTIAKQIFSLTKDQKKQLINLLKNPPKHNQNLVEDNNFIFFYNGIFSQWYKAKFHDEFHEFNCAEQYMMFKKAELFHDEITAKRILKAKEPRLQKSLGREVRFFDETLWRKKCEEIVYNGNKLKFTQNKHLYDKLLETKGKILVEASPTDKIWGNWAFII